MSYIQKSYNDRLFERDEYDECQFWRCLDGLWPGIICDCGSSSFMILQPKGVYETIGKCVSCGKQEILHDG